MYHPSRGGVRGGRDQFKWDDVKVDKHRENYLGHSLKAPVGRWQKGKDLFWYVRDKNSQGSDQDALKAEIQKVKEEEEQMMREALGLAPKRSSRRQGNTLDKHEFSELVKRGSTAEDMGEGHAEAAKVHGLGFDRAPRSLGQSSSLQPSEKVVPVEEARVVDPSTIKMRREDSEEDENVRRKRRREERKRYKEERREKKHSRESNDKRKHRKDKAAVEKKRRHDSD